MVKRKGRNGEEEREEEKRGIVKRKGNNGEEERDE